MLMLVHTPVLWYFCWRRLTGGKLEQSYLNFRQANPFWTGDAAGRAMEERLQYFKAAT